MYQANEKIREDHRQTALPVAKEPAPAAILMIGALVAWGIATTEAGSALVAWGVETAAEWALYALVAWGIRKLRQWRAKPVLGGGC